MGLVIGCFFGGLGSASVLPVPTAPVENFMKDIGFSMFMHYSVTTYANFSEHNCAHGTPCLPPSVFTPSSLNVTQWVETAAFVGAKQICITAHHEGGFALWNTSNNKGYTVMASPYGKDILKPFIEACKLAGISPCAYLGPNSDGYLNQTGVPGEEFIDLQLAMTGEMVEMGMERLWWDHYPLACHGLSQCPDGTFPAAWPRFVNLVRSKSESVVIGRGPDVAIAAGGESGDGSYPNYLACTLNDDTVCQERGLGPSFQTFRPQEADATIQNPGDKWFWHPNEPFWSSLDIWEHFFLTYGRGLAFILNAPPNTTGLVPDEYRASMKGFGDAWRSSFGTPLAQASNVTLNCSDASESSVQIPLPSGGLSFNAVRSREDVAKGQRIGNYTIEYVPKGGSDWQPLPDGSVHGATVGYRIFDFVGGNATIPKPLFAEKVRFRCVFSVLDPVYLDDVGLYFATPPKSRD